MSTAAEWSLPFLDTNYSEDLSDPNRTKWALIVLNQAISKPLFMRLWHFCHWRAFADGGSNRVYDVLGDEWKQYLPDLISGDMDSIRPEVRSVYDAEGVSVVEDGDQYATDLMKCYRAVGKLEESSDQPYRVIILGGLTGRLDQTIHTLSFLHKQRKKRKELFAITEENIGWVLDEGEHRMTLDRTLLGPTCGILPLGIDSTILTMEGLEWNWTDHESSFDGDVSTSNWLAEDVVTIKTSRPVWWTVELRKPDALEPLQTDYTLST